MNGRAGSSGHSSPAAPVPAAEFGRNDPGCGLLSPTREGGEVRSA